MAAPSRNNGNSVNNSSTSIAMATEISDICHTYIPHIGCASALMFSTNVMHPMAFRRITSPNDSMIANSLWFNSHLGVGLYLYNRKHMRRASTFNRVLYSVYGAVLFNFSLVLFWATTKALLPRIMPLRMIFGVGAGCAFFAIGKEYLDFVDKQAGDILSE